MTEPTQPEVDPAVLDTAVEAAARRSHEEVRADIIRDAYWPPPAPWDELSDLDQYYWLVTIRPHIETAWPIIATAIEKRAHAAGAAKERERIVGLLDRRTAARSATTEIRMVLRYARAVVLAGTGLPWLAEIEPELIARAGTSEGAT